MSPVVLGIEVLLAMRLYTSAHILVYKNSGMTTCIMLGSEICQFCSIKVAYVRGIV